jgi:serine/threonine protein kinase
MPQFNTGQLFGRWTTEKFIAKGGNGEVWRASAPGQPDAAIKLLMTKKADSVAYERFRREVRAVQEVLPLPGVLPILDVNLPEVLTKADRAWHVMPLATSLEVRLERAPVRDVVEAVAEVGETLAALHARGIRHRDIKPGNLMWLDGRPQVSDFGLVSLPDLESIEEPGRVPGSLGYISNEMMADPLAADAAAADVFALAKVLWKLLVPSMRFPPQGPLRADGGPATLTRSLLLPSADVLDRILEAATRPETTRTKMDRFAAELRSWLELPTPSGVPSNLAGVLAAARASMTTTVAERDRAAVRKRETDQAQKVLVAAAQPVVHALKAIDPVGAVVGTRACPPGLRKILERSPGLTGLPVERAFHHGVRIERKRGLRRTDSFVVAFAMQVDSEGTASVAGLAFVGDETSLRSDAHFVRPTPRHARLGAEFEVAVAATIDGIVERLNELLEHFTRGAA